MAFQPIRRNRGPSSAQSLVEELRSAKEARNCSTTGRVLLRATLGLRMIQAEIVAARHWETGSQCQSNAEGRICWAGKQGPLLLKRYRLCKAIGTGSFSDVFSADDILLRRRTAIKVIRLGCEPLGYREQSILSFLSGRFAREPCYCKLPPSFPPFSLLFARPIVCLLRNLQYPHFSLFPSAVFVAVVRILGCANLANHFCVVMDHYPGTLITLLQRPAVASAPSPEPDLLPPDILRPRPLRGLANKDGRCTDPARPVPLSDDSSVNTADLHTLRKIALHLVSALCILHKDGLIHGDIKPENCFVEANVSDENASRFFSLRHFPDAFCIRLGDFSNALHVSEISDYFRSFELQSLPYRAPEVLVGLPFGPGIDLWSLGVLLLELLLGRPLFTAPSRQEMIHALEQALGPIPRTRFSGGKFSDLLFTSSVAAPSASLRTALHSDRLEPRRHLRKLVANSRFSSAVPLQQVLELVDFLGVLLAIDPDQRATAMDALQHPFLSLALPLPTALMLPTRKPPPRPPRHDAYLLFSSLSKEEGEGGKRKLDDILEAKAWI